MQDELSIKHTIRLKFIREFVNETTVAEQFPYYYVTHCVDDRLYDSVVVWDYLNDGRPNVAILRFRRVDTVSVDVWFCLTAFLLRIRHHCDTLRA